MASTNLAYINEAVGKAVEKQIADPTPFVDTANAHRRIAGIKVYDGAVVERATETHRQALRAYQADEAAIKQKLETAGVSYLTVVPTTSWDAITKAAGLFRFEPNEHSAVRADTALLDQVVDDAKDAMENHAAIAGLIGAAAGVAVGIFLTHYLAHWFMIWTVIDCVILAIVVGGLVGGIVNSMNFDGETQRPDVAKKFEYELLKRRMPKDPDARAKALWPNLVEPTGMSVSMKIELPEAPEDAQTNLLKAHEAKFKLTTYVVGGAIRLIDDPIRAFLDTRKGAYDKMKADAHAERERRRIERESGWDPIVVTRHGSATAIIVQYGDFPIEQEVVDRVMNSKQLIF
ncbi:MAG: hypothetical protein ABA06_00830 [Parcubacteria bacterium C7867-001]|nr:MAG: hypothetical protein ABA06_00830 [Parcubacteria bacterium C7867-001]